MDALVLVISVLSLLTNVFLVRHFTKGRVLLTATLEEFTDLPLPSAWQDAADEVLIEEPAPAAAPARETSAWKNQTGIQQGVSATPAPPFVKPQVAPLARPGGFV